MGNLDCLHQVSTVQAVFAWYEAFRAEQPREYLGVSELGERCWRKLWFSFRHVSVRDRPGRVLRLLDHGHTEEERLVRDLVRTGFPVTRRQEEMRWLAGHVRGHIDGVLPNGCLESSRPHLLEIKTASGKQFRKLCKQGVECFDKRYWVQAHLYMHGLGLRRCLFLAVCKDDDDIYQERIHYDREVAEDALEVARAVVHASEPPPRESDRPDWWRCKMCEHANVCHHGELPARTCRTCDCAVADTDNGGWWCDLGHEFGTTCRKYQPVTAIRTSWRAW